MGASTTCSVTHDMKPLPGEGDTRHSRGRNRIYFIHFNVGRRLPQRGFPRAMRHSGFATQLGLSVGHLRARVVCHDEPS